MHAHPDLIERLGDIAGSPHVVVPLYGVAVIVHNGVVAVVALGTDTLLFRLPQAPEGVEVEDHTEPLCSKGWHAVSPWQSQLPSAEGLRRLRKLLGKARHYADELNAAGT
ncbi:hypothetical protein GA0070624_5200 [Micromonospora rhizosphaerae]|uniref:YjbR protein n=1 Tax=Micromonospora rhizosphaerae TaxID=568872 RepID=A0A1C6T063_9ACTN|nr:hypothetical protein [Micromonospora rhizosphaerae]SCL35220.1 hypothetical protein GA0070624_5200 [Micromonospora rhizosphaerae]